MWINFIFVKEKSLRYQSLFSMSDFMSYYEISQSKAKAKLSEFEKNGIVEILVNEKKKTFTSK